MKQCNVHRGRPSGKSSHVTVSTTPGLLSIGTSTPQPPLSEEVHSAIKLFASGAAATLDISVPVYQALSFLALLKQLNLKLLQSFPPLSSESSMDAADASGASAADEVVLAVLHTIGKVADISSITTSESCGLGPRKKKTDTDNDTEGTLLEG